jgi:hypothetical protein
MNKAFRFTLCLALIVAWSCGAESIVVAQSNIAILVGSMNLDSIKTAQAPQVMKLPQLPESPMSLVGRFSYIPLPLFRNGAYEMIQPSFAFTGNTVGQMGMMLQGAILKRLGIRYRFTGTDDRGYDCSGFVWRVFQDAGADFERVPARVLWNQLPEAKGDEIRQFGTLVFFNGLKHIGIVRDNETFYHSSRSQGVVLSQFAGYWSKRLTGYRRAPTPLDPQQLAPPPPPALTLEEID